MFPSPKEPAYRFVLAWGKTGSGPGELRQPIGIAVEGDRVFVSDAGNHRVQVLDPQGRFLRQIGETGKKGIAAGSFNYPTDVALLSDGEVAVADAYNDRIQVFDRKGNFLRKWGGPFAMDISGPFPGWFRVATAVAADHEGNLFAADFYNHRVQKFTGEGRFLVAIGGEGSGQGELRLPTDVAVDEGGNVYVVDFGHDRIVKFAPSR